MGKLGKWVAGALGGVLALGGLFMAANATDNGFYAAGLVVFLVGLAFTFYQLKRGLDEMEAAQHAGGTAPASGASGESGAQQLGASSAGTATASTGASAGKSGARKAAGSAQTGTGGGTAKAGAQSAASRNGSRS